MRRPASRHFPSAVTSRTQPSKSFAKSIRQVLTMAEKAIVKNDPEIISGEIRDFLSIHNAKRERSPGGAKIIVDETGGRKTYYTDEQKLFR